MRLADRPRAVAVAAFVAMTLALAPNSSVAWAVGPEQLPPPVAGADEINDAARDILARPEFRPPARSLYQRLLDAASDALDRLVRSLIGNGRGTVLAVVVAAIALALAVWLVSRGLRSGRRRRGAAAAGALVVEGRRPAVDWEAEAAALEAGGDWRGALRCHYRALVARLAGRGVVEEVPGRTTGEYRAAVGATAPAVLSPFAGATDLFERAWYGNQPTGPDEASSFRRLAGEVLEGSSP